VGDEVNYIDLSMKEPGKRTREGLPHNPGVRELVDGKRRWSAADQRENAMRGFKGWYERGFKHFGREVRLPA
jgi:hypothetical protein